MENSSIKNSDNYIHGMDWQDTRLSMSSLGNYRKWQYELVSKFIGKNILEVGSGDRGFTLQIVKNHESYERILSIEPSKTLFLQWQNKHNFPYNIFFENIDIFDLKEKETGKFDTIIFIHVLEHIKNDREALDYCYEFLLPGGNILIEVPAIPSLYSVHDQLLGHYRRYNKKNMVTIIDRKKYEIVKMRYQDIIGILGSYYFFKKKKIMLNSESGAQLVKNQGLIYDKYIVPIQKFFEKFVWLPFGLSLTVILRKK